MTWVEDAVLICGQSNGGQKAASSGLPVGLQSAQSGTQHWCHYSTPALHATTGVDEVQPIDSLHGLEITLAQRLQQLGRTPLIIQIGTGDTNLASEWLPPSGAQYSNLLTRLQTCVSENDLKIRIRDIVWVQGEKDSTNSTWAAAYEANLGTLFAQLRLLGPLTEYVTAHIIRTHADIDPATYTELSTVRTAQQNFTAANSWAKLVDVDDLELDVDEVHYTSAGYQAMGTRIANSIAA